MIVEKFWKRKGILGSAATTAGVALSRKTHQIQECICELVPPRNRMSIEKLLSPADEGDCIQEKSLEFVLLSVVGHEEKEGKDDADVPILSMQEQLWAVSVMRRVVYVSGTVDDTFISSLCRLCGKLSLERARGSRQTTINILFKRNVWNVYTINLIIGLYALFGESRGRRRVAKYRELTVYQPYVGSKSQWCLKS